MKYKSLVLLHSIIYAVFAIVLFAIPKTLWPLYGVEINDKYANFLSQHNSIFLGGIAIFAWLFKDIDAQSQVAKKFVTGLMWINLLGVIITLTACFSKVFVGFGWSDPIFFGFLAVLCLVTLKKNKVSC